MLQIIAIFITKFLRNASMAFEVIKRHGTNSNMCLAFPPPPGITKLTPKQANRHPSYLKVGVSVTARQSFVLSFGA